MTQYSAIILAGGKSSRMGQKKGLLRFQERTFIDIIIDKLQEAGISEIMVSGYEYDDPRTIFVEDVYPNKGPVAGIHAGLRRSSKEHVFVIPEDAPLVPVDYIRLLMEEHLKSDLPITVASANGRIQQLIGVYDKSLAEACESILQEEKSKVMSLIERFGCAEVPFNGDEMLIRGCNTPEEFEEISRRVSSIC